MGMFDSLGSLGSITKVFDVGNVVKGVVDKMLPQNLQFVGDVAGAFVDFKTGNFIGAAQLGMEAMKDLPQAAKGQQPQGAAGNPANGSQLASSAKPALEPSPPPLQSRDGKAFDWNDLLSAVKALAAALAGQGTPAQAGAAAPPTPYAGTAAAPAATPAPSSSASTAAATPSAQASSPTAGSTTASTPAPAATPSPPTTPPAAGSWQAAPATMTARSTAQILAAYRNPAGNGWRRGPQTATAQTTSNGATWRGQPTTAAPAAPPAATAHASTTAQTTAPAATAAAPTSAAAPSTTAAAPAPAVEHPAAAASTSTSTTATKPATGSSTSAAAATDKGQTISSLSQLNGMNNTAFMDAVSNGRISPDVAKDPAAMMAIQQRMNDITQMNNLMTAMMRAIHDMQMAVIQNIRI